MIVQVRLFDTSEKSHPGNFKQKNGFYKEPSVVHRDLGRAAGQMLKSHSQELCSVTPQRCLLWKHHGDGEN